MTASAPRGHPITAHKFKVGETVELIAPSRRHVLGLYQIVTLLPVESRLSRWR
jgi:hypothetical protein